VPQGNIGVMQEFRTSLDRFFLKRGLARSVKWKSGFRYGKRNPD
jgi:hypothetical protein